MLSVPQKRQTERFASSMIQNRSSNLTTLFPTEAGFKAALRFIHNPRVEVEELNAYLRSRRTLSSEGGRVLLIDDTTTINLNGIRGKLRLDDKTIGVLTDDKTTGQFYHTALLWDEANFVGNILSVNSFSRSYRRQFYEKERETSYKERESYRWLDVVKQGRAFLPKNRQIIKVSDREGDAYQHLLGCLDLNVDFVVRSQHNRNRLGEKVNLHDFARSLPPMAEVTVEVERSLRRGGKVRLELAWSSFTLKAPTARAGDRKTPLGRNLDLYVVIATEPNPPKYDKPLQWIIITSLPVERPEQALDVLAIYRQRWIIEELFKILKSACLNIEKTQLSKGQSIIKLTTIAIHMALEVLLLKENRENEELEARRYFSDLEIKVLESCERQVSGTSKALRNPYKIKSLAWAVWIIARLGGWAGLIQGQSPPGTKTLAKGLERFLDRVEWTAFQENENRTNDPSDTSQKKLSTD